MVEGVLMPRVQPGMSQGCYIWAEGRILINGFIYSWNVVIVIHSANKLKVRPSSLSFIYK